ncbi:MarC family protein [Bacteriovoracaceae bacterium]|nr:MarC family protein [Bacteriovoracaceae bacterium]
MNIELLISQFIVLWAVIDPIGTIPVFIAVTKGYTDKEKNSIARSASIVAFIILLFFALVGEFLLGKVGVPLAAFQTSGGVILFMFAMNMIFGDSKPEEELQMIKKSEKETAIFPLAIPSIAGPGAILALVLLAETKNVNMKGFALLIGLLLIILFINYLLMRGSTKIHKYLGNSGAIVISKVMGLILASMAANNILMGIKEFFKIKV